jgi:hypothetical protein
MSRRKIPGNVNLRRVTLKHGDPQEGKLCREIPQNIVTGAEMAEDKGPEGSAVVVSLRDTGAAEFQEPLTTLETITQSGEQKCCSSAEVSL